VRSLNKNLEMEWMREADRRPRKDGATGGDGRTAEAYAGRREERRADLSERVKAGTDRAPPVRRTYIPQGDGRRRPLGITPCEEQGIQRAGVLRLDPVDAQEFLDGSSGYRPGRSAHTALDAIWKPTRPMGGWWLLDADSNGFVDTVAHQDLKARRTQRVGDGGIRRLVSKWVHAGVWEAGQVRDPEKGTPQGGVLSPLRSNSYRHEVRDTWFEEPINPRLEGGAFRVR
jgi:retron-type reverse transcriptase